MPYRHVVRTKVVLPPLPAGTIDRSVALGALGRGARCTLVCAMPGFGKTTAVRRWVDTVDDPVAWVSLDLLDLEPRSFWSHVLYALGSACPGVDEEAIRLLNERGPADHLFLSALLAELARNERPLVLVLDGLPSEIDPSVLDGLTLLVERCGASLRLVVCARTDPALPLVRWEALGWLSELREADLRLSDEEARSLAASAESDWALGTAEQIAALNGMVDGWPIGYQMALMAAPTEAAGEGDNGDSPHVELLDKGRDLASYFVAEVLASLTEQERHVALTLSVVERFDSDLCIALVGEENIDVVGRLLARPMFLTVVDPRAGVMRFPDLVRDLLETELRWSDPLRRVALHRRVAMFWRDRGNLMSAYHHLDAIGAIASAQELLVDPALDLVDRGELAELRRSVRVLPRPAQVTDPRLALGFATLALYADGTTVAGRWADRIETLLDDPQESDGDADLHSELRGVRCGIALLDADLDEAVALVERHRRPFGSTEDRFVARFPILAARVMLAARRPSEADEWITFAEQLDEPEILTRVTVPTLRGWHEWWFGRLPNAVELLRGALQWMSEHRIGPHHLAFDALITAGWCQLAIGSLPEATRIATRAAADAEALGTAWNQLQAGYLEARVAVVVGDPLRALELVEDLRQAVRFDRCHAYTDRILAIEVEALAALGRSVDAHRALASMHPSPRTTLMQARIDRPSDAEIEAMLEGRAAWPAPDRFEAELVLAARRHSARPPAELSTIVEEAGAADWVLPFLGHGPRVEQLLRALPLERIHPKLLRALDHLAPTVPARIDESLGVRLTSREQSLLELLPTHLTYAKMGEQLFLSVHTVKANLGALYRKLGASSRSEAVEIGRRSGLL